MFGSGNASRGETHSGHVVQFYDSDELLAASVAQFLADGLVRGEAACVIATAPHRDAFRRQLAARAIADWCAVAVVAKDGTLQRVAVVHKDHALRETALEYERNHPPPSHHAAGVLEELRARKPVLREHVTDDYLKAASRNEDHLR